MGPHQDRLEEPPPAEEVAPAVKGKGGKKGVATPKKEKFFGLTPTQAVGLLGSQLILSCEHVQTGENGEVVGIVGRISKRGESRPKGNLHWIAACGAAKDKVK
ncbi:hypothetical protein T484DRAFT_1777625 [Baffinella frigidus]|nr:hypothetical protein T484DRAFT_1777625 [Cryptophyta sp. CCMP2293]